MAETANDAEMFVSDFVGLFTDLTYIIPVLVTVVAMILFSDNMMYGLLAVVGVILFSMTNRRKWVLLLGVLVVFDSLIVFVLATLLMIYLAFYADKHAKYFKRKQDKSVLKPKA